MIFGSNGNRFVQEMVEVLFDNDGFVIHASSDMEIDVQSGADFLEEASQGAVIIDNN